MFQSVIDPQGLRSSRIGTGAGVSLLVHAGLFAAALLLSAGVAEQVKKDDDLVIKVYQQPPRGNPTPAVAVQQEQPRERKKPNSPRPPREVPTARPPEIDPPPNPVQDPPLSDLPHVPGGDPEGVETGGTPNVPVITGLEGALTRPEPTGEEVLNFTSTSMKPPQFLSGPNIQYTREALEARVQGILTVKCVVTREGNVEKCRVLKGLPHMDEAVLEALEARRYRPVEYGGRPVSVSYIFQIKLDMPR